MYKLDTTDSQLNTKAYWHNIHHFALVYENILILIRMKIGTLQNYLMHHNQSHKGNGRKGGRNRKEELHFDFTKIDLGVGCCISNWIVKNKGKGLGTPTGYDLSRTYVLPGLYPDLTIIGVWRNPVAYMTLFVIYNCNHL